MQMQTKYVDITADSSNTVVVRPRRGTKSSENQLKGLGLHLNTKIRSHSNRFMIRLYYYSVAKVK
jgi:hypothetical protein